MERLFDQTSLIKILKDGLKKTNPKNPKRMMWTLEDLDKPPPGWKRIFEYDQQQREKEDGKN